MIIRLPGRVTYANARGRAHWSSHAAETRDIRTWFAIEASRLAREENARLPWSEIEVEFLLRVRGRVPDTDAVAPAAKAALDGIVDAGIVRDDTGDHVRAITFHAPEPSDVDELVALVKRIS